MVSREMAAGAGGEAACCPDRAPPKATPPTVEEHVKGAALGVDAQRLGHQALELQAGDGGSSSRRRHSSSRSRRGRLMSWADRHPTHRSSGRSGGRAAGAAAAAARARLDVARHLEQEGGARRHAHAVERQVVHAAGGAWQREERWAGGSASSNVPGSRMARRLPLPPETTALKRAAHSPPLAAPVLQDLDHIHKVLPEGVAAGLAVERGDGDDCGGRRGVS